MKSISTQTKLPIGTRLGEGIAKLRAQHQTAARQAVLGENFPKEFLTDPTFLDLVGGLRDGSG